MGTVNRVEHHVAGQRTNSLPEYIEGPRQSGRTTRLVGSVIADQEDDPDLDCIILVPYNEEARWLMSPSSPLGRAIDTWLEGERGVDPARTTVHSVYSLGGEPIEPGNVAVYIDNASEIGYERLRRLLFVFRNYKMPVRAIVFYGPGGDARRENGKKKP